MWARPPLATLDAWPRRFEYRTCKGGEICAAVCPVDAIRMVPEEMERWNAGMLAGDEATYYENHQALIYKNRDDVWSTSWGSFACAQRSAPTSWDARSTSPSAYNSNLYSSGIC